MKRENQFLKRLKFVKWKDIFSIFPMVIGYIFSIIYRVFHVNMWLICERKNEARDNGYWFYKYMRENHPEIETIYAINKDSIDYKKIKNLGKIIQFGSLMHWICYFAAKKNISSQKEGKPNAALCYILEVYLGARKNRVYLKHGITKDAQRWIYYDVSKINMLCCASNREYKFIKDYFGYPSPNLVVTGLCRFDNLLSLHEVKRQILIMPTMREWLRTLSSETLKYEKNSNFIESEYFITWDHLLKSADLAVLLNNYRIKLIFYLHPAMQQYIQNFLNVNDNIIIADADHYDMQQLLMSSAILVTDYSSIFFDFAYMLKPLVYYQFDYEKYRKGQYQQGYFEYERDGFGPVVKEETTLINTLREILQNNLSMGKMYRERAEAFYAFHDKKNCERVYEAILNMQ